MFIFGMVIVLAFQICILLMSFTASFSKGTQQYESWQEFPIDFGHKMEDFGKLSDYVLSDRAGGGPETIA